jgi:tetratricopeptide (TPR) repeat protein
MELKDQLNNLKGGATSGATKVGEATVNLKDQQVGAAIDKVRREDHPSRESEAGVPAEAHFLVGTALFQLQRYDDAVAAWEQAIAAKPDFAPVYNNLALAYWKTGQIDKAQASLARAEELGLRVNPQFKADLVRAAAAAK